MKAFASALVLTAMSGAVFAEDTDQDARNTCAQDQTSRNDCGHILFIEHPLPPMDAGDYQMEVPPPSGVPENK